MKFVFDIDGTICFDGIEIDRRIVNAIKSLEVAGNQVIFASARPIRDLVPVVSDFSNNTLIGGNGSIVSIDGSIEVCKSISEETFEEILRIIDANNVEYIVDDKWNYASKVNSSSNIIRQLDPGRLAKRVRIQEIEIAIKVIMLNMRREDYDVLKKELNKLSELISIVTHEESYSLDITSKGINKYTTLNSLIGDVEYVAFGNDNNDFELLKNATIGYYVNSKKRNEKLEFDHINQLENNIYEIAATINSFAVLGVPISAKRKDP